MRYRATFQKYTVVDDGAGGGAEQWADEFSTWAEVIPLRSSNRLEDNQVSMRDTFKVKVRWYKDREITVDMRMVFEGKHYAVTGVVEINERRRYFEVTVQGDGK